MINRRSLIKLFALTPVAAAIPAVLKPSGYDEAETTDRIVDIFLRDFEPSKAFNPNFKHIPGDSVRYKGKEFMVVSGGTDG